MYHDFEKVQDMKWTFRILAAACKHASRNDVTFLDIYCIVQKKSVTKI